MKLSFKPHNLVRYKQILGILLRHLNSDLRKEMAQSEFMTDDEASQFNAGGKPEQLADDLERLGPTFVKVGQLLSSRPDLLPEAYLNALARLQDKVKPFSFGEVEEIVEAELGARLSKAFSYFEAVPLAIALRCATAARWG